MAHKILLSIFVVAISLLPLGIIATATFAPERLMRLIDLDNGSGIIKKASVILGYLFFVAFCFGTAGLIAQPIAIDFAQIWYGDDFLDHELTVIYYFFLQSYQPPYLQHSSLLFFMQKNHCK